MAKLSYFLISGEALLDLIKEQADLPNDTKLIKTEIQPSSANPINDGFQNVVRFIVESSDFPETCEGEIILRINIGAKMRRLK